MSLTITVLESRLGIQLPADYLGFVGKHGTKSFDYRFNADEWRFWGYSLAFSDLAMHYYKGTGLPQSTRKAYELLLEAERLDKQRDGGGYLEPVLKRLAAELEN